MIVYTIYTHCINVINGINSKTSMIKIWSKNNTDLIII